MFYKSILMTAFCALVFSLWLLTPFQALASATCTSLLLDLDVSGNETYGVERTYKHYVDDIQEKFDSDFDCKMDFEKKLSADKLKEMGIDFYKMKRDFYGRKEVSIAAYNFSDYDFVVGFQIVDYTILKAVIYDVTKKTIFEESRSIRDYSLEGNLRKRDFLYLIEKISPEAMQPES